VTQGHPDAAGHPAASGAVVTIHGLRKHYAATQALAGVDLELRAGEVYGLVGANGSQPDARRVPTTSRTTSP